MVECEVPVWIPTSPRRKSTTYLEISTITTSMHWTSSTWKPWRIEDFSCVKPLPKKQQRNLSLNIGSRQEDQSQEVKLRDTVYQLQELQDSGRVPSLIWLIYWTLTEINLWSEVVNYKCRGWCNLHTAQLCLFHYPMYLYHFNKPIIIVIIIITQVVEAAWGRWGLIRN